MKKALTVGELLVTMVIIGVISLLVIPGFMRDYTGRLTVTRLKRVYSLISNAMDRACVEQKVSYFSQTSYYSGTLNDFLRDYFNIVSSKDNFSDGFSSTASSMDGSVTNSSTSSLGINKAVVLKSGESIAVEKADPYVRFLVDVNAKEAPNVGGRDIFLITFDSTTNSLYFDDDIKKFCGKDFKGTGCFETIADSDWNITY